LLAQQQDRPAQPRGLTPRQLRFVEEYLVDLNATEAYKRAGYTARNDNVAAANASALIRNHKVSAAIQEGFRARSERTAIDQDYVLRRLKAEAELRGEGASHSARVRALELLGKHLGMFPDRIKHGGDEKSPPITFTEEEKIVAFRNLMALMRARGYSLPAEWLTDGDGVADGYIDGHGAAHDGNGDGAGPVAGTIQPDDAVTDDAPAPLFPEDSRPVAGLKELPNGQAEDVEPMFPEPLPDDEPAAERQPPDPMASIFDVPPSRWRKL
jgi:hypothetical protein